MNTHKNARLTFVRRLEMVQDITNVACQPHRPLLYKASLR